MADVGIGLIPIADSGRVREAPRSRDDRQIGVPIRRGVGDEGGAS